MHARSSLKSNTQAAKLMQPCNSSLDDPSGFTQTTAMRRAAAGNLSADSPSLKPCAQAPGIVGTVSLKYARLASRCAALATNGWNRLEQGFHLRHIVAVGLGQNDRQRDTLGIRENVVFAARTTAIGWVRSTFFPAPTARIEELSAMAREKSNLSAPRSLLSNSWCSRSQTRAFCHALRRRQQVMPEPQPISLGNISQGIPERSTNSIPPNTLRSHSGSLPVWRLRRRFFGSNGSMCFHKSSSTSCRGMRYPPDYAMPQHTKFLTKVQVSFC